MYVDSEKLYVKLWLIERPNPPYTQVPSCEARRQRKRRQENSRYLKDCILTSTTPWVQTTWIDKEEITQVVESDTIDSEKNTFHLIEDRGRGRNFHSCGLLGFDSKMEIKHMERTAKPYSSILTTGQNKSTPRHSRLPATNPRGTSQQQSGP